jgi:hypothetical protein
VIRWWAVVCFVLLAAPAAAEWQLKPFAGIAFGGSTTFVDAEVAAGRAHRLLGVNGALLGEIFGLEADVARVPGFFQSGDGLFVLSSSVVTLTGNLVIAMPRRVFQYTLRPYFVAGAGILRAHIEPNLGTLPVASTRPAMDIGGGATGFLSDRLGVSWELRHFRSIGRGGVSGTSVGLSPEQLAFWRVTMAMAIRY